MGFLSRLFGKGDEPKHEVLDLEPTAEMMDEDKFWALVQQSLDESGGDQECQENVLVGELEKLTPKEIVGFRLRTDNLL
jgi:hypothetical protein